MLSRLPSPLAPPADAAGAPAGGRAGAGPRPGRALPLRGYLLLHALALAVPTLAFVGLLLWQFAAHERDRLEGEAVAAARSIAEAVDRELAGLRASLDVLATSPFLQTGDLEAFHAQAEEVERRQGIIPVLRDPSGQQLVNARLPWGAALPRTVLAVDGRALASDRPEVSDLFVGAVSQAPLFTVAVTVRRGPELAYLLSLSLDVARVRRVILDQEPPAAWTVAVVDRNGVILARNHRHDEFAGQPATRDLQESTRGRSGTWRGTTADGAAVFGAYARSRLSDWRVAVGLREADLRAPVRRSLAIMAALGLGLAGAAAVPALALGRRVTGATRALERAAAALGRGEPVPPLRTPLVEADRVGLELTAAAAALGAREAELRRGEERYRTLVEATTAVSWATAPDGEPDGPQPAWAAFTGRREEALRGAGGWLQAVHPADRAATFRIWRDALAAGTPFVSEHRLRRADGAYRHMAARAVPVREADGHIREWVGVHVDVTERREAEAELLETNEEVQRYAYIVSHDLRAPLVNVMGFTSELETLRPELFEGAEADPARARLARDFDEALGFIKAAIGKMDRLINAILKISREGRRAFRPERLDMGALVQGLADAQRHQTDAAGARVEVGPLPELTADRLAVEQIFGNLLDNAVKYLDPARPGLIEVTGEAAGGGRVAFTVADNGRGIAPQDHGRVFELFRRAGAQDRPGEGIGLAHVRALVRSLGGRIELDSEPGRGTAFAVTLPAAPPRRPGAPRPEPAVPVPALPLP